MINKKELLKAIKAVAETDFMKKNLSDAAFVEKLKANIKLTPEQKLKLFFK